MSHYFFLTQSIYLIIFSAKFFFPGAIGRVHPEGKDGLGTRIFSAYIGGTRPLKRISEHLYQPRRPAVRFEISFSYMPYIFIFISFCLSFSSLLIDFTSFYLRSHPIIYFVIHLYIHNSFLYLSIYWIISLSK